MADRRAQVEARLAAATPGPWRVGWTDQECSDANAILAEERTFVAFTGEDTMERADADLIASAPADLRWLLDALAEAEAGRDDEASPGRAGRG